MDPNTVIVGHLYTPLSSRQKINQETSESLHTLDQMGMVGIYRVFHSTTRQCTSFSKVHETFSKIDHILGHKAYLNKFKKI
jgi:hypothetical protein